MKYSQRFKDEKMFDDLLLQNLGINFDPVKAVSFEYQKEKLGKALDSLDPTMIDSVKLMCKQIEKCDNLIVYEVEKRIDRSLNIAGLNSQKGNAATMDEIFYFGQNVIPSLFFLKMNSSAINPNYLNACPFYPNCSLGA